MEKFREVDVVAFPDAAAIDKWLAGHHTRHEGVWVKVAKKASGIASVTDDELVDVGLCWGWISGQRRGLDDCHYLQTAAGRMREPGLAEVQRAQEDGRWDRAYASQATAVVPDDLAAALDALACWRSRTPSTPVTGRSGDRRTGSGWCSAVSGRALATGLKALRDLADTAG